MQHFNALFCLIGSLVIGSSLTTQAAEDIPGAGDHPDIPRLDRSYIVHYDASDYDSLRLPTGPLETDAAASYVETEGEVLKLSYLFEDTETTTLRIIRSYEEALQERDFKILYSAGGQDLSSDGGRLFMNRASDILKRGVRDCCRMANRDRDIRYLAAQSEESGVTVGIAAFNARRHDGPTVSLAAATDAEMVDQMAHRPLDPSDVKSGLVDEGRVALQDILFELDSDRILDESEEALAVVADVLTEQDDLSVLIVGHTDASGDFRYNLELSMARATAVVDWLEDEGGIAGERLRPAGAGMLAPIASNRSEAGRAKNRRVEIVEVP